MHLVPVRGRFSDALVGCRNGRLVCALGLALLVVALVPLAAAIPLDPLWIAGFYDAADGDDGALLGASLEVLLEQGLLVVSPLAITACSFVWAGPVVPRTSLRGIHTRAPPKS
jgi:hypothetical protein